MPTRVFKDKTGSRLVKVVRYPTVAQLGVEDIRGSANEDKAVLAENRRSAGDISIHPGHSEGLRAPKLLFPDAVRASDEERAAKKESKRIARIEKHEREMRERLHSVHRPDSTFINLELDDDEVQELYEDELARRKRLHRAHMNGTQVLKHSTIHDASEIKDLFHWNDHDDHGGSSSDDGAGADVRRDSDANYDDDSIPKTWRERRDEMLSIMSARRAVHERRAAREKLALDEERERFEKEEKESKYIGKLDGKAVFRHNHLSLEELADMSFRENYSDLDKKTFPGPLAHFI